MLHAPGTAALRRPPRRASSGRSLGKLVPGAPVDLAPGDLLPHALTPVRVIDRFVAQVVGPPLVELAVPPLPPPFEVESSPVKLRLVAQRAEPVRVGRTRARTALATGDDPVHAVVSVAGAEERVPAADGVVREQEAPATPDLHLRQVDRAQ